MVRRLLIAVLVGLVASAIPAIADISGPPPVATPVSRFYLFSMLNEWDQAGPKTYTSVDGIYAQPLTAANGGDIYTDAGAKFRDPRVLKVGTTYFLAYTNATITAPAANSIGLATSNDLKTWTKISTPNWSSLFAGSQNSIWNGCWFLDPASGNYYFYFATAYANGASSVVTPYVVTFNPANNSFGTPQALTISPSRGYADLMGIWLSGGTYYAMVQDFGSGGGQYVELLTASSPTGTWTVSGANNFAGWGSSIEAGTAIVMPNGNVNVYFVDYGGGHVYYSTASGNFTTGASWSSPTQLYVFGAPTTTDQNTISMDWVDIVAFSDIQTAQAVSALHDSGGEYVYTNNSNQQPGFTFDGHGNYVQLNFWNNATNEAVIGYSPSGPQALYLFTDNGSTILDFGTNNTGRWSIGVNGGLYSNDASGSDEGADTLNVGTKYYANGTAGVTCSGSPTSSFATVGGIVTHC